MNIGIRKWRLSDAKDLAKTLSNRNVMNNLRDGLPYPYTKQDAVDYITAMMEADENETFAYAVTVDDKAVGSIGAFRQGNIHSCTAELGYYLGEQYWGQGIMTEAIRQICQKVFADSDIIRIYAEPFSYNVGSCRALEKAGFQYEGTLRNNAVKNGKVQDMKMYALTREKDPYSIRRLDQEKLPEALSLVWEVFCKYEAPEYPEEGIAEFQSTIEDPGKIRNMKFYGAFAEEKLVGVLAMRTPQHISLFFVQEAWHRKGIGKRLFDAVKRDYEIQEFTVNSSPYAVEGYRHLGFIPTASEQITNGIRYTPMRYRAAEGGKTPLLETERLILRPFRMEDAQNVYECWESDPDVAKYMFWSSHHEIEKTKAWLRFEMEQLYKKDWYRFAIEQKHTNELMGTVLIYYEEEVQSWEIAYNLGKKYWGKGYITEAAQKVLTFAADELKVTEIVGRYAKENPASGKVLKKLGFQYEKEIPYICNDGTVTRQGIQCRLNMERQKGKTN